MLRLGGTFAKRLREMGILTVLVALLNLPLKILCEFSLLGLLVDDRVAVQRGLAG